MLQDLGKKPAAAAHATESMQQKLDRTWVETANAWGCDGRLEEELGKQARDTICHLFVNPPVSLQVVRVHAVLLGMPHRRHDRHACGCADDGRFDSRC